MAAGQLGAPVLQERGGDLPGQLFFLGGKKAVVFPENEAAGPVFTGKALFTFRYMPAAAGADAHNLPAGGKRCVFVRLISLHQRAGHGGDAAHEAGGGERAALDLLELFLPFGGQRRGFELLRQDGD